MRLPQKHYENSMNYINKSIILYLCKDSYIINVVDIGFMYIYMYVKDKINNLTNQIEQDHEEQKL